MSIAVKAIVRPSRLLRWLGSGLAALGLLLCLWLAADLAARDDAGARLPIALAGAALAAAALWRLQRAQKAHTLDISANGEIRLAEDTSGLRLRADSTLWPGLLLLRLEAAETGEAGQGGKAIHSLLILPASVGPEVFRRLSLACRWIAAHAPAGQHGRLGQENENISARR